MHSAREPQLAVNGVVADFAAGTLLDSAGNPVPLRPQAFEVLRHLAANPGRLVTKDELMAAVWRGVAVTDDSLVQCIHDIRRAIGDEARSVLVTVPRRGYRLVPPGENRRGRARSLRRWPIAAAAAAALALAAAGTWWFAARPPPGQVPLVAVLPFDPVTAGETSRLLADGLTEDLITDLARFPEFAVLAGGATEPYRGEAVDLRSVGARTGARFAVEGSIAHEADRVRVTAQLFDADSGRSLWSERWDRPTADFFAVQGEISEEIANRLGGGAGLVQEAGRNQARRKPPASLDAYELYLLGTERLERLTQPELEAALDLLTRAVEIDPGLARAWIELFHSRMVLAGLGVEPEQNRALAAAAAERALSLDPGDPEAHVVYGASLALRGDFVRAEAEYETALRLAPNAAEILIFYIDWASSSGKPERGADLIERAIRLDPNYPTWANRFFAYANFMAGRYEQAVAFFERLGTERHNRRSWSAHAGAVAALGRHEQAAALVDAAQAAHPGLSIEVVMNLPGTSEAEKARYVETMRLAGFPPCATPEALAEFAEPQRLAECLQPNAAAPAGGDG